MKYRIPILTATLFCFLCSAHAQTNIQGTVLNEKGQPLMDVNVLLLRATDSALVKGIVSGKTGAYTFNNITSGNYLLSFTFVGHKKTFSPLSIAAGNKDDITIGEIKLPEEIGELAKVTVSAKKPLFEQKTDRLVINVQNSITSTGSTALDVLERSPGVTVDRQNSILSMGGKEGVVVMINGKENHLPMTAVVQMLAGMNSANIDKIELITTPPANFNAEGNAGIINIVLINNNSFGTNGSFAATLGASKNKLATFALNFNHRQRKMNLYGDFSFLFNKLQQAFSSYRKFNLAGQTKETYAPGNRDVTVKNFSGRLGIDLQVSKKTVIGAMVAGYNNNWSMNAISQTSFLTDQQVDTLIYGSNDEVNRWKSISVNLNMQHTIRKGEQWSINADYLNYNDKNPDDYFYSYYDGSGNFVFDQQLLTRKITPISFWVGSSDYSKKINKNLDLQTGIKFTSSGFTNDILIARLLQHTWVTDESLSAKYDLKENISAAYISLTANPTKKVSMKFGLRYEYTTSNLGTPDVKNIIDRHYGKLFPSFFISGKIHDNSSINFSYSRRITRPSFNELAPFTIFFDPNSVTTGNPALQPSISDALMTSYSYKNYIFSLNYSYEAGAIVRFQPKIDPATNRQINAPENLKYLKTLALTVSVPLSLAPWWSMQTNLIGRLEQSNSSYKGASVTLNQKSFRFTSTQSIKLFKNLSMDISGFYQSSQLSGRAIIQPRASLDCGLQTKTEHGKGKLSVSVTDIFSSNIFKAYTDIPEQDLLARRMIKFDQRIFKLTYSRSFGNSKLENNRNRQDNSAEERKRVE
ncbi:MAG: outer membrane beta-barrel protein [Chitinophagaceae bacterium]